MRKYDTPSSPAWRAAPRDGTVLRQCNTRTPNNGGHRPSDLCAAARRASHEVLRQCASAARRFATNSRPIRRPSVQTKTPSAFTGKKHDRAKSRSTTPDGARRDTAPTPEIRDGPL
ncbi:hypothetical protein KEC55_29180 [Burkholderia cepacia]|uniref:hypothetical protein n=1 Tax=Burkholderia cepacia TaxID=292 RepID=UPI00279CCE65|nr:hypothetical protein KEC55_29180 [Burkholderia cepacia]